MNNERIKLFTDSDLDGASCGVIGTVIFNDIDITYSSPAGINELIEDFIQTGEYLNYSNIFITDLVIKEYIADLINKVNSDNKFILLDHHKSNYTNNHHPWVNVHVNYNDRPTCGTELFWIYIRENIISCENNNDYSTIDEYVEYVRLWDTWDWTKSNKKLGIYAKNLNTIFTIYSISHFVDTMVDNILNYNNEFISDFDYAIINIEENKKQRYIKQKMKNVRILEVDDYKIGYVFGEEYVSELGNYIAKNIEGIDFAAIINADIGVVSLRAIDKNNDIDLSKIAKFFSPQGGGHKLSAGFVFDIDKSNKFVNNIFNK